MKCGKFIPYSGPLVLATLCPLTRSAKVITAKATMTPIIEPYATNPASAISKCSFFESYIT